MPATSRHRHFFSLLLSQNQAHNSPTKNNNNKYNKNIKPYTLYYWTMYLYCVCLFALWNHSSSSTSIVSVPLLCFWNFCCLLSKCYLTNKVNYTALTKLVDFLVFSCELYLRILHIFCLLLYYAIYFYRFMIRKTHEEFFMWFLLVINFKYIYTRAIIHWFFSTKVAANWKAILDYIFFFLLGNVWCRDLCCVNYFMILTHGITVYFWVYKKNVWIPADFFYWFWHLFGGIATGLDLLYRWNSYCLKMCELMQNIY